jgi:hypothetical protein
VGCLTTVQRKYLSATIAAAAQILYFAASLSSASSALLGVFTPDPAMHASIALLDTSQP